MIVNYLKIFQYINENRLNYINAHIQDNGNLCIHLDINYVLQEQLITFDPDQRHLSQYPSVITIPHPDNVQKNHEFRFTYNIRQFNTFVNNLITV